LLDGDQDQPAVLKPHVHGVARRQPELGENFGMITPAELPSIASGEPMIRLYIDPSSALSQERAMEVDKVAMNCSGAWAVSQFGIFAVWIAGGRPALVYLMPNNHQASAVQSL
jgi:hypothetical protein